VLEAGIGRIEWLDLRAVWKDEAADFTPWLLQNVDVLRDALGGLDLELERAEHPVGTFSLDLIGKDLTHGTTLIVENQIEGSDHGHFGQLLTYTAGTDAGTIVWIAKNFREEHRGALDWLNEHTGEGIRFFGVVAKALRIGVSPPAPFLEVVVKPNDWQKTVRRTTPAGESSEAPAYRAFWEPLRERFFAVDPDLFKGREIPKSNWFGMDSPLGRRLPIAAEIGAGELRVILEIDTGDRKRNLEWFNKIEPHQQTIEAAIGELDVREGTQRMKIMKRLPWDGKLLTQPERHDEARAWFYENLTGLQRALQQIAPSVSADS